MAVTLEHAAAWRGTANRSLAWVACAVAALLALATQPPVAEARGPRGVLPPGSRHGDGGPSPVVFPPQRIPIRMTHDRHVKELGLDCTDCHTLAISSQSSRDNLLPPGTTCDRCHLTRHGAPTVLAPADEPLARCALCHVGHTPDAGNAVAPVSLPAPNLVFSHALHDARNIGCAQCHGTVREVGQATREQLPRMRGCMKCHGRTGPEQGDATGDCKTCHLTARGVLKTRFSAGVLVPPAWLGNAEHGPQWIEGHKAAAGANSQLCASCHTEDECADCHDGRVRPRSIHPNDWLTLHGVASAMASQRCTSCHRQQSFCVTCHARLGLTESGPLERVAGRGRYHPPSGVWTDGPRSRGHHAWEAQRNLEACVGCHVERDCATCHATAARGGPGSGVGEIGRGTNPHPVGFSGKCAQALKKNPRACLVCHEPGDAPLERCR